jgi:uncharacterized protein (DUF934 family)
MQIIKQRQVVTDSFAHVADEDAMPSTGSVIVSLARFNTDKAHLGARRDQLGVQLKSDQTAQDVAADLDKLAVIAIEFPKFRDGRGFSTARLLRDRYGYKGEIRAVGHVIREQLFYMARCGFDAFELAPGKDIQDALSGFDDFQVTYQGAADDPRPLYRRR